MPTTPDPAAVDVRLNEWQRIGPREDPRLADRRLVANPALQAAVQRLKGRVDIHPSFDGLLISTTSFVGRVTAGPLQISIAPKLDHLPLTRLLSYAYGLSDLTLHDDTAAPTAADGFRGLLLAMLAREVEWITRRGLPRQYRAHERELAMPRGRILMEPLAARGGILGPRLPCRYHEQSADNSLNRVLRSGLELAIASCVEPGLRLRLRRLMGHFDGVASLTPLRAHDIARAQHSITRLTEICGPALTLIALLLQGEGVELEEHEGTQPLQGFLFDMNMFFQRLLSRFLHEHLDEGKLADESTIRGLFRITAGARGRRTPAPRPDFAIVRPGQQPDYLDAKYRDLAARGLPAEWLYQMSLYAWASSRRTSVLLYATTSDDAIDECIEVLAPTVDAIARPASVILRPVPLRQLAHALASSGARPADAAACRSLARWLVRPGLWPSQDAAASTLKHPVASR